MRTTRKLVVTAALATCLAALPALGGCDADQANANNQVTNPATPVTSSGQSDDASSTQQAEAFSPSDFLDDNGYWKDVNALDYVTLCQYTGIPVTEDEIAASEESIQAQIDSFAQNNLVTETITDRAVADGDTVNIDYVGSIDGVEFAGGSTGGNGTEVTIGVTNYIPGFLDQLVGHTPGENFDIDVTFPDDYGSADLAGKDAVFNITINSIIERSLPEVTDDWVANTLGDAYGWSTVDEMRQGIADAMRNSALALYVQNYVIDNSTISEVPAELITYQEEMLVNQYQSYASMYGMDLSTLLPMMTGYQTTEELVEANRDEIERTAQGHLVFQAIAQDAGMEVTDEDVAAYIKTVAGSDDVDGFVQIYGMPYLKMCTLIEKVGNYLIDNVSVTE